MMPWVLWGVFPLVVLGLLALDLGVFHKDSHEVRPREALMWTGVWVALALTFGILVYYMKGPTAGLEYLTGYLIEESLSMDNIFVFVMILGFFKVPRAYQHRVLFWGVIGALILRAIMIGLGASLVHQFHWILYIFGAFLVYTGIKMAFKDDEEVNPEDNPLIKYVRKVVPVTHDYHREKFLLKEHGKWMATPLLLVLVMIETSDVIFALDSIPAIFSVTTDGFIVYTSNIFAIMGLRSLYFLLASVLEQFRFLKYGICLILTFVGAKMLVVLVDIQVPISVSLGVIIGALALSIIASLLIPAGKPDPKTHAH
ncbi:MAG TPA: TerC family protein [Symbiobacteriaceae bacterium]|jgi:tellurite resistance protein TerC